MFFTVGLEFLEKGINNHLTTVHQPFMNTLVHTIRFCARESVAHAQKEYKVQPRFKCLKLVCTILDLKLNQLNKIGVQYEAKSRNLHDCKLMIQEMWELYDVTLQMIVSFKSYVMNFVDFVFNCYSHITSHVSQVFASCTHYISYSLLNIVHIIMCVFWSNQPSSQIL